MKRVLLKLSGEALSGDKGHGFDDSFCNSVAKQIKELVNEGIEIGIVIGGGNFWRGRSSKDMDRVKADQIGMLATVMNCLYFSESLKNEGIDSRIVTPFEIGGFADVFNKDKVIEDLKNNKIVFFAGGTGHPYFSTDTNTILRAIEIEADAVLIAKSIDGVYDSDPSVNKDAKKYSTLTLDEIVEKRLQVIDMTASILALENKMKLVVFGLKEENSIIKASKDETSGTTITV